MQSNIICLKLKMGQGKDNLNLDKVNQVLRVFGHEPGPVIMKPLEEI